VFPGWLAAVIACALAAALAIVAMPGPREDDLEAASLSDAEVAQIAVERVRETGIAQRPEWRVGDAWRVQFNDGDPVCWMVVARAAETYRQGVACETDEAEFIAVNIAVAQVAFVGTFTRDLEGVSDPEGDATRWFDWPLSDGKSWDTTFEGIDVVVTAAFVDGAFELVMVDDEDSDLAFYDYDPSLRWWSQISFATGGSFHVHERTTGWSGPVSLAAADERFTGRGNLASQSTASFTTTEADTYVVLLASRPAVAAEYWELAGPSETRNSLTPLGGQPLVGGFDRYETIPAEPGEWSYRQAGTGIGGFLARIFVAQVETVEL